MYAKPLLVPLDLDVPQALCCEVWFAGSREPVRTPMCGTPACALLPSCSVYVPIAAPGSILS